MDEVLFGIAIEIRAIVAIVMTSINDAFVISSQKPAETRCDINENEPISYDSRQWLCSLRIGRWTVAIKKKQTLLHKHIKILLMLIIIISIQCKLEINLHCDSEHALHTRTDNADEQTRRSTEKQNR